MKSKDKITKGKVKIIRTCEFLNLPEYCEGATVKVKASTNRYEIIISDCSRSVRLHDSMNCERDKKNALFKIKTLQENLEKLKNFIEALEKKK